MFIWKWKQFVSPLQARESKIVSVYMVYLQGMSHQFEINAINVFTINFEILVNFLNVLLASEKTEAIRF